MFACLHCSSSSTDISSCGTVISWHDIHSVASVAVRKSNSVNTSENSNFQNTERLLQMVVVAIEASMGLVRVSYLPAWVEHQSKGTSGHHLLVYHCRLPAAEANAMCALHGKSVSSSVCTAAACMSALYAAQAGLPGSPDAAAMCWHAGVDRPMTHLCVCENTLQRNLEYRFTG